MDSGTAHFSLLDLRHADHYLLDLLLDHFLAAGVIVYNDSKDKITSIVCGNISRPAFYPGDGPGLCMDKAGGTGPLAGPFSWFPCEPATGSEE